MPADKKTLTAIARMVKKYPSEVTDALLTEIFWPEGVKAGVFYTRRSDDSDGSYNTITVATGPSGTSRQGDTWIDVVSHIDEGSMVSDHCFRDSFIDGGRSHR